MATWGGWNSSNRFRIGYNISVSKHASYYRFTVTYYLQTRYYAYDQNGVTWSSTGTLSKGSSSKTFNHSGSMQTTTLGSISKNVNRQYGSKVKVTWHGYLSHVAAYGGSSDIYGSYWIPARKYAKPAAPSNAHVSSYSDDHAHVVWSNHATSSAPYSSLTFQLDYVDGNGNRVGYGKSKTLGKGDTSYNMATGPDVRHYYRVRANNSSGSSGWAYLNSGSTYPTTTAKKPTAVRSSINTAGDAVTTTWTNQHRWQHSPVQLQIGRTAAPSEGSGDIVVLSAATGAAGTSYTDTSPNNGFNKYWVRTAVISYGGYTSYSDWVEGNAINTIVPPLAPTDLNPDGGNVDLAQDVTFTWVPHDGGDGAVQSHYRFKVQAGDFTELYNEVIASEVSEHVLPADTVANGDSYFWTVATQGSTQEGFGPQTVSTVQGTAVPTVTVMTVNGVDPVAGPVTVDTLPVQVTTAYQQDQNWSQASLDAYIYTLVDDLPDQLVAGISFQDRTSDFEFTPLLDDGQDYILRVRVRADTGQRSDWEEVEFTVDLLPPAATTLSLTYYPEAGVMGVDVVADEGVESVTASVVSFDLERRIDDAGWVTVIEGVEIQEDGTASVLDVLPTLTGVNQYRAKVLSIAPSNATTDVIEQAVDYNNNGEWTFVNYGEGFADVVRAGNEPKFDDSADLEGSEEPMLGRSRPVSFQGEQETLEVGVSATLVHSEASAQHTSNNDLDSGPKEWREVLWAGGTVCLRTPAGHRVFGRLHGYSANTTRLGITSLKFTVTQNDFSEALVVAGGLEVEL